MNYKSIFHNTLYRFDKLNKMNKVNKKILEYKDDDLFLIFYVDSCPYCVNAIQLLNDYKQSYKGYNLNNIDGGIQYVLNCLVSPNVTSFNPEHKTKPLIFHYGKFLGGYQELKTLFSQ